MKYFSAQYIITNTGRPLKRGIICTRDDGTVISVDDYDGDLPQKHSLEYHNGIIIPGFVNCHCHLELSWMKGNVKGGGGLGAFLTDLNSLRDSSSGDYTRAISDASCLMEKEGVVLCADLCNSSRSFAVKKKNRIKYISLLEVFGYDPQKAAKRAEEISDLASRADKEMIPWQIVPHSVYSVSKPLFRLLRKMSENNTVTSIHFLESEDEAEMLSGRSGRLMEAYRRFLSPASAHDTITDHTTAVLEEITSSGNLLLVHNTFISREIIKKLKQRKGIYYCLCPNSNRYISGVLPPVKMLREENCDLVVGTDSLASNSRLSMIEELKTLQQVSPETGMPELVRWATLNGARALGEEKFTGSIEPGKKPGLVLIKNADLVNMRLLPESTAIRLI